MSQATFFLKPNVIFEPLVDRWYAWAHLIPPATAARNISGRHLKIMDSFISAPEAHVSAVKDPKLLGGPFMDLAAEQVGEVQKLRDQTVAERADLLALSAALDDLTHLLRTKATGYSLESLYAEIPEPLKGFVELVYDLNNHPSYRLIEPLLFRSRYYDEGLQSLTLSLVEGDERPFVLSTPRLSNGHGVNLRVPFRDDSIDFLARLKTRPATSTEIRDAVALDDAQEEEFRSLLTPEPRRPYAGYTGDGARWRYFGHACILLETQGLSILLDPVLSYESSSEIPRYTYDDLPDRIDYVLITHNHQDHILFETLLQLRHRIGAVVVPRNSGGALQDPSLRLTLRQCGFSNVIDLAELDEIAFDGGSITAIPFFGEHADLNILTKMAYLVRLGRHALLFAADSCNIDPCLYRHVHKAIGDVEILFLGMECDGAPLSWLYGPLLTGKMDRRMDHSRRLAGSNYERALGIVEQFRCQETYVYAMGQEPWLKYIMSLTYTPQSNPIVDSNALIEECRRRGIVAERLFGEKEILLHP
ncbi:MAG TPA: MBL fold metallo-hydrolase [Bryobacteraceae bacterium]|nr:MBL fold metallo-hydrolase [Bryobacteraceae bacterium]